MSTFIRVLLPLCLLAPLGAADPPAVPAQLWQVAPAGSTVAFHGSSTLHDFDGTATVGDGRVDLTPGHEAGIVTVAAASLQTGNAKRDRTMHADHLQSAVHPAIAFTLERLDHTAAGLVAHGVWSMHGVDRHLDIPVTLSADASGPVARQRLAAAPIIDMRQWGIPVPVTAWVISVDPLVQVRIDLLLEPATGPLAPLPARPVLGDLTLPDLRGAAHALGAESAGRLLLLCDLDGLKTASRCAEVLARRVPAATPLLRVLDLSQTPRADRDAQVRRVAEAAAGESVPLIIDRDGAVRARLKLPAAPVLGVGFASDGTVSGEIDAQPEAKTLTRMLELMRYPATPPITAEECGAAGRRGR